MNQTVKVLPNGKQEPSTDEHSRIFSKFIEKVGPFGRYQKILLLLMCLSSCMNGQIVFITPLLFYEDPYECSNIPSGFDTCNNYVCSLPQESRHLFTPVPVMQTLCTKFGDFRCAEEYATINVVIMIMYSGTIIGYLILSLAGDYFGRKTFLITGLTLGSLGLVLTILSNNIYVSAIGLLISSIGNQTQFSINMNIITEVVGEQSRESALVLYQIGYSLGHLVDAGLFFWLKDHQSVLLYFFIIPLGLFAIIHFFLTVETPIVLITNKTPQEALQGLQWMAKVNGVSCPDITLQLITSVKSIQVQLQETSEKTSKFSVLDLFRYASLRIPSILMVVIQISISFLFFAPNLMLADFNPSIFLTGVLLGGSNLISALFCYFSVSCFKRKNIAFVTFGTIFICSVILVFIFHPTDSLSLSENIGILVLMFVFTFCIQYQYTAFYVYMTELYPTQVRVIGLSVMNLIASVTLAVSSFIIEAVANNGFSVMILFAILAVVSIVSSVCLPQTYDVTPKDLVSQLSKQAVKSESKKIGMSSIIQIECNKVSVIMGEQQFSKQ